MNYLLSITLLISLLFFNACTEDLTGSSPDGTGEVTFKCVNQQQQQLDSITVVSISGDTVFSPTGIVTIGNLAPGNYTFEITRPGYALTHRQVLIGSHDNESSYSGLTVQSIVAMHPLTASAKGIVTYTNSEGIESPAINAVVILTPKPAEYPLTYTLATDSLGNFSFLGLPNAVEMELTIPSFSVAAAPYGMSDHLLITPYANDSLTVHTVTLTYGTNFNSETSSTEAYTFSVNDPSGAPISGATISLPGGTTITSDGNGFARINMKGRVDYGTVTKAGYSSYTGMLKNITLYPLTASVEGTVTYKDLNGTPIPLTGIIVTVNSELSSDRSVKSTDTTDINGYYTFAQLPSEVPMNLTIPQYIDTLTGQIYGNYPETKAMIIAYTHQTMIPETNFNLTPVLGSLEIFSSSEIITSSDSVAITFNKAIDTTTFQKDFVEIYKNDLLLIQWSVDLKTMYIRPYGGHWIGTSFSVSVSKAIRSQDNAAMDRSQIVSVRVKTMETLPPVVITIVPPAANSYQSNFTWPATAGYTYDIYLSEEGLPFRLSGTTTKNTSAIYTFNTTTVSILVIPIAPDGNRGSLEQAIPVTYTVPVP